MPSVAISAEHDKILEEKLDEIEEEVGVRGTKKKLVEDAIEEHIDKSSSGGVNGS